jgi:hypothetical protein
MLILKDPEMAQRMGIISTKAQIAGTADWPSYLGLLAQAVAIGGLIIFGFVSSWVFGREYADRTIKDLLALPIFRTSIVIAKFILVFLWCLLLSTFVFGLGLLVGRAVAIPGWPYETLIRGLRVFAVCSLLTISLSPPVALLASVGRGYLPPLVLLSLPWCWPTLWLLPVWSLVSLVHPRPGQRCFGQWSPSTGKGQHSFSSNDGHPGAGGNHSLVAYADQN